jgi:hypothetical protein
MRRINHTVWWRAVAFVFVTSFSLEWFLSKVVAVSARGVPANCKLIPDPAARAKCFGRKPHGGISIPNPIKGVEGLAGDVVHGIVGTIVSGFTNLEAKAVVFVLNEETKFVTSSTTPTFTAQWFKTEYIYILGMVAAAAVIGFYFSLTKSAIQGDVNAFGWSWLRVVAFFVLAPTVPLFVGALVTLCDKGVSPGLMSAFNSQTQSALQNVDKSINDWTALITGGTSTLLLTFVFLLFGLIGAAIAEIMLTFRELFLYVSTAGIVVAGALSVSGYGKELLNKSCLVTIALIFFKPVMALILVFGIGLLSSGGGFQPIILGATTLIAMPIISLMFYRAVSGHDLRAAPAVKFVSNKAMSGVNTVRSSSSN